MVDITKFQRMYIKHVIIKNAPALPCILLNWKKNRKQNTMWVRTEWIIQSKFNFPRFYDVEIQKVV